MDEKTKSVVKTLNSSVFDAFKTLASDVIGDRLNGGMSLMQYLHENRNDANITEQLDYILNRLVRGLGASTNNSRSGFYSALVTILTLPITESLTIDQLLKPMEKWLHVGKEIENKEDSHAVIGRILVCGSLIMSMKLYAASDDDVSKCVQLLVTSSHYKLHHSSLAYSLLIELLKKLPSDRFNAVMWPTMKQELKRPWERHNINTIHFLLALHGKYPELIDAEFLESSIKETELFSPTSFEHFLRIFWQQNAELTMMHPAHQELTQFLCKSDQKQLVNFWKHVDNLSSTSSKIRDVITIKMLTTFFQNDSIETKTLLKLLSERFVEMIVKSVKNKQTNRETTLDCYDKFFEAVNKRMSKMTDDSKKVKMITKFVLHPGALSIEKYTTIRVVRQMITHLGSEGVKEMTEIYKSVFVGARPKDPNDATVQWLNVEKQYAAQMMQFLIGLKVMQNEVDWHIEQSKFMAGVSFFYTSNKGRPVMKRDDSGFVRKDLGLKNIFYSTLQAKLPNLKDENRMLLELVTFCNEFVSSNESENYLREPWTQTSIKTWMKMYKFVTSTKVKNGKKEDKLDLVFRILFMHMGLQLFSEHQMAEDAIADLTKCVEKVNGKKLKSNKLEADDELQWIEVVVDLFLHLLSRGSKLLKVVVNKVFPHLCSAMSMTAVHQILSVLDMKVSNPLSSSNDSDESDGEGDDKEMNGVETESDSDDDEDNDNAEEDEDGSNEEDEGDSNDDDDEGEDVEDEDEGTAVDQLRNDLSAILAATSDTESIDVDDMTQEEADKLDRSLSAVFQMRKKTSSKKKTKNERTITTAVMHFRIRVLDLIEIYLKSNPSLEICLETILALFNMIEFCVEKDLKQLSDRVDKVLVQLLKVRDFSKVTDVTEQQLSDLLTGLINRKVDPSKVSNYHKLLPNLVAFTVSNLHLVESKDNSVVGALTNYAKEFLDLRNPTISFRLMQDMFKLQWTGVWQMAVSLCKHGIGSRKEILRLHRRNQLIELLEIMYKNHGFIRQNASSINKQIGQVETTVDQYVNWMCQTSDVKPKEFSVLVSLLCEMYKCSTKVETLKKKVDWKQIGEKIQSIRVKLIKAPVPAYQKFCGLFGIKAVKSSDIEPSQQNGNADVRDETRAQKRKLDEVVTQPKQKIPKENKKQKKLKKEERLRIASEGLNGISFAAHSLDDDAIME